MVQSFSEWVKANRAGKKQASSNRTPTMSSSGQLPSSIEEDIDDLLSDLGSTVSATPSALGRMITRHPPTVMDARVQRLEHEVLKLADEVKKLAQLIKDINDMVLPTKCELE